MVRSFIDASTRLDYVLSQPKSEGCQPAHTGNNLDVSSSSSDESESEQEYDTVLYPWNPQIEETQIDEDDPNTQKYATPQPSRLSANQSHEVIQSKRKKPPRSLVLKRPQRNALQTCSTLSGSRRPTSTCQTRQSQ